MQFQNFSNVATFEAYEVLTKGFKDVANYAKQFAKYEVLTDTEFKEFAKHEVVKFYNKFNILEGIKLTNLDEINASELRKAIIG